MIANHDRCFRQQIRVGRQVLAGRQMDRVRIGFKSGRFEVYVQAFPGPSQNRQVSIDGGTAPVWAPNGRELFYRKDTKMMAVDVSTTREFVSGRPKQLFDGSYLSWPGVYDVARDGRFLMLTGERQPISQIILVQNWFES